MIQNLKLEITRSILGVRGYEGIHPLARLKFCFANSELSLIQNLNFARAQQAACILDSQTIQKFKFHDEMEALL